jgi:16S rRNA U1498 N3-methylase RsmE
MLEIFIGTFILVICKDIIMYFIVRRKEKGNYVIYLEARNHLYKYDRVVYTTKKEAKAEIIKAYKNENNNNATFLIFEVYDNE